MLRGRHSSATPPLAHEGFSRGLVQRLVKLPHVPSDEEWGALLRVASTSSVRNRLMLALGYYGALRRSELLGLQISVLDPSHRLISLRADRRGRPRKNRRLYSKARRCGNPGWAHAKSVSKDWPHGLDLNRTGAPKAGLKRHTLASRRLGRIALGTCSGDILTQSTVNRPRYPKSRPQIRFLALTSMQKHS